MKLHSIGFRIRKTDKNAPKIERWKQELSIKKNTIKGYGPPAKPFGVYRETNKYLYMPRFFEHNEEYKDIREDGLKITPTFNGQLRPQQQEVEKLVTNELKDVQRTILCLKTGMGKCHARNTEIIMYNGSTKYVQDIVVGDKVMGEDSKPRTVLSLGTGKDQMFEINSPNSKPFVVNSIHILSLKDTGNTIISKGSVYEVKYLNTQNYQRNSKLFINYVQAKEFFDTCNTIIDIPLNKYLELNREIKNDLKLYKVAIDFKPQNIIEDPYNVGLRLGHRIRCKTFENNYIPTCYKINTRKRRLELLAGLVDSCAQYLDNCIIFSYCTQNEQMMYGDILYLARSLGLWAYIYEGKIRVSGDLSIIPSKLTTFVKQGDNKLETSFEVIQKGYGDYYGFTIDGNHRYLLGDFTVTHNTICGLKILANISRKTLIVVHKHFLMKQWEERIKEFLPDAKIGYFYGNKCDIEGKDIILGMLQSLSLKDYSPKMFGDVGFTIFDEVHSVGAEQFSKALLRITSKYVLGLSATPYRGDGLTKILYLHFGKILDPFKTQKLDQTVNVNIIEYQPKDFKETRIRFGGYNFANMTNQLVENKERNDLIVEKAIEYAEEGRSILILSGRVEHVKTLAAQLDFMGISVGVFVGGMKMDALESATEKQVIVATYNMFKEGIDVQKLNTLIFATPISKITQAVGRILRKKHLDHTPLIVDIWDTVSQFETWGATRQKYYKSKKFVTNLGDYVHKTRAQLEQEPTTIDISNLFDDSEEDEENVVL